jgi:hypothetical protein
MAFHGARQIECDLQPGFQAAIILNMKKYRTHWGLLCRELQPTQI